MADTNSPVAASRRAFLAGGLLAPAPAAFTPSLAAGQAPRGRAPHAIKIGAVTYNIAKDWDVPTIIKNFATVGLDAVELRTTHAHGVELALTPSQRAEVRKQFEASTVKIGGLGTTCGQAAADAGVRIQVEVHGAETQRIPRIVKMLQYAERHPGVWICWNSNPTDLMDGGLEKNFGLLKDRIGQVHMRDLYVEEYPWQRLINLLQEIEFPGYCFAELGEVSSDGVRVLKYFRGMFRQFEGVVTPPLSV